MAPAQNTNAVGAQSLNALPTELRGRRLFVARALWVGVVSLTAVILAASVPAHLADLHRICSAGSCVAGQLTPAEARALGDLGVSSDAYIAYVFALDLVVALGFCMVGVLVFWRRSREPGPLFVSFALMVFGLTWPDTFDSALHQPLWGDLARFLTQLGLASLFVFFFVFPDGRFVPRWSRWVVLLLFVMPVLYVLFPRSILAEPPMPANLLVFLGLWACCALAQVYRYGRVSGPVERQQTKWVVFGVTVCVALLIGFLLPVVFFPDLTRPGVVSFVFDLSGLTIGGSLGLLLIPLSIGAAILRYRLYDIDIIINRALVYGSLTLMLLLVYFGGVVGTQAVFRALTGQVQQPQLAVVGSTLAIAALFIPLRRRIQSFIDRRFYRKKYDAAKTLESFSRRLRDEVNLENLADELLTVVEQTIQPAHASLWLRDREERARMRKYR
jgi:hypothetical protein